MKTIRTMLEDVTHEDLIGWAGETIYDRGKGYTEAVSQLSRTEDDHLVAWVAGTDDYATRVRHEGQGDFDYKCTCPYSYGPCKHAVAVLLKASVLLKRKKDIPLLAEEDDLSLELFVNEVEGLNDDGFVPKQRQSESLPQKKLEQLQQMLSAKSRDQLQGLVLELVAEFPAIARKLREQNQLESGQVDKLVASLRKEIGKLTSVDPWYSHWEHRGNLPDYSHLQKQLEILVENGYADAVLSLAEELWTRGIDQVERSDDDGMTGGSLTICFQIVLSALPDTSFSPSEQLLWLAEHELKDDYGLLGDTDFIVNDWRYSPPHWCEAAEVIARWLKSLKVPEGDSYSERYQRQRVVLWLRSAYERGKETDKVIPLLEKEAKRCGLYEELVKALRETGETERAQQWCVLGFHQTIKDSPGIASSLKRQLRDIAAEQGRFDVVAAYLAQDFLNRPALDTYKKLADVADKISVWSDVRAAVLEFLLTGKHPDDQGDNTVWSLPQPQLRYPKENVIRQRFPDRAMMIEIAIYEKRFDDAVAVYNDQPEMNRWNDNINELLARAVADSHPDTALGIWRNIAENIIRRVNSKEYPEAVGYLRKMHKIYDRTERLADWQQVLLDIRTRHKAKRRLMAELNKLENSSKLID